MLIGEEITVLGAGIGGLAAALAMARRGATVEIIEQAAELGDVGAGIQISANGARVLEALGLGAELAVRGMLVRAVDLCDGDDGVRLARIDLAARGPGMEGWFLHRADLIAMLAEAARAAGVRVHLGRRVEEVRLSDTGAELVAGGRARRVRLLVGADGINSRLRVAIEGPSRPFFTGAIAWRAMIRCESDAEPVAEVHTGRGRHVVSYPLRGGSLRNVVAVETRTRWVEESWSHREDALALRAAFADFGPRVQGWLRQIEDPWLWGLFRHPVARNWGWIAPSAPGRGAVLLGDSAHPTLPFLAQGANMALEDGWVLAALLARHDTLAEAIAAYERLRAPRCARIVGESTRAAGIYHLRDPWRGIVHGAIGVANRVVPKLIARRYDWIHRHDVTRDVL